MNNFIQKTLIALFLLSSISIVYGQNEVVYNASDIDNSIQAAEVLEFTDPNVDQDGLLVDSNTTLMLRIIPNQAPYDWYTYVLKLQVTPRASDGTFEVSDAFEVSLLVEQNLIKGAGNGGTDISKKILKNTSGAKVVILEGTYKNISDGTSDRNGYVPENLEFSIKYTEEKYTELSIEEPIISHSQSVDNELLLEWSESVGAESYQLEWTWIDNYGDDIDSPRLVNEILFSEKEFKSNSTRVEIKERSYSIPLIYSQGYIIYRVRAVGRFLIGNGENYRFGRWSSGVTTKQFVADWPNIFLIDQDHQQNMNWQFQASYAEQGKKKEVVSYFDGTLRNRQTVTKINSDDHVIIGEVIYDAQGRPAIEVLPVPTIDKSISFYPDFNQNSDENVYSFQDFDLNEQNILDELLPESKLMSSAIGASKYYSSNNDINDAYSDRVPDAAGFPFSQVEYTSDNTGRISRKSGVGITHQLGSGQEMEYYYGLPEQKELNRLFGYSVGHFSHYKKNLVIDPNGQASISYIDPQGRTIATALSGYTSQNLISLPDEANTDLHKELTVDLLGKVVKNDKDTTVDNNIRATTLNFGTHLDVLSYTGTKVTAFEESRTINYNLVGPKELAYSCDEENNTVTYPFVFDLTVDVLDRDANTVLLDPINQTIDLVAEEGQFTLPEINVQVPRGNYSISKVLTINTAKLEEFAINYIERLQDPSDACYISPDTVSDLPTLSFEGCFVTCEECVDALAFDYPATTTQTNREVYASIQLENYDAASKLPYLTASELEQEEVRLLAYFKNQWDGLVSACEAPCTEEDSADGGIDSNTSEEDIIANSVTCNVAKGAVLNDMKPLGQYGVSTINTTGEKVEEETETVLNIFNEQNKLWSTKVTDDLHNSWRNPRHMGYDDQLPTTNELYTLGHYYNEDGTISYIKVQETVNTTTNADGEEETTYLYEPNILEGTEVIDIPNEPGYVYVEPQFLENVSDFIKDGIWQNSWSESLLVYHPEYNYLVYAEASCAVTSKVLMANNALMNSDGYDTYIRKIGTYDAAKRKGFLANFTTIADQDPYFNTTISLESSSSRSIRKDLVKEALEVAYNGGEQNIMKFTYATLFCNSISSCTVDISTALDIRNQIDGLSEEKRNQFWNTYIANYFTIKQTIQSLFASIYAEAQGGYNGCIGLDEPPVSLLTVISDYSSSIKNRVEGLITKSNDICDDAYKSAYVDKEKRFKPSDVLFNSGDSNQDIYDDIREETNYEYYVETGICPLGRDLQLFLNYHFKEAPDGFVPSQPYAKTYLTPSLFEEMGGEHPTDSDVDIEHKLDSKTLTIQVSQSGTVLEEDALTVTIPETNTLDWNDYGENDWVITNIKNMYPSYTEGIGFTYDVVAQVKKNSADIEYDEVILSGTTIARISNCSITEADGVGEYLHNDGTIGNQECNKQSRFESALTRVVNELVQSNQVNTTVALNNLPVYQNSYLPQFFGNGVATWSRGFGATYVIAINEEPKMTMELDDFIDDSVVESITGVNFSFSYNRTGKITRQNVRINTLQSGFNFEVISGIIYENCGGGEIVDSTDIEDDSVLVPVITEGPVPIGLPIRGRPIGNIGTCSLINFLCCGNINDLVGTEDEEPYDCTEADVACSIYQDTEALFESHFLKIMNAVIQTPGSISVSNPIDFNTTEVADFKSELKIQQRFEKALDDASENFTVYSNHVKAQYQRADGTRFKLLFYKNKTETSPQVGFFINLPAMYSTILSVREFVCFDILSGDENGTKLKLVYRLYDGSIGEIITSIDLGMRDRTGGYSDQDLDCEFFGDTTDTSCNIEEVTENLGNDLKNLLNAVITNDNAITDNLNQKIPLKNYSEFTSLLQDYFTYTSAEYCTQRPYYCQEGKAVDFSNIDQVSISVNSRIGFIIQYSDIFGITFSTSGINATEGLLKRLTLNNTNGNVVYDLEFENTNGDLITGAGSTYQRSYNMPIGSVSAGLLTAVTLDCDLFTTYTDYPLQPSPDLLDNNDIDVCSENSSLENIFEETLKDIFNTHLTSSRSEEEVSKEAYDRLFFDAPIQLNDRFKSILEPHYESINLEYNADPYPFLSYSTNFQRYNESLVLNSTRPYLAVSAGFIGANLDVILNFEEDFVYDNIDQITDIYILRQDAPQLNFGQYAYSYFCTIKYKNFNGEIEVAKNVQIKINRKESARVSENRYGGPRTFTIALCDLLSVDLNSNFNKSNRVFHTKSKSDLKQLNTKNSQTFEISEQGRQRSSISLIEEESFNCDQQICIPTPVAPKSCTDEYGKYVELMNSIDDKEEGDVKSKESFCNNSLQYLVDDYAEYLSKFQITSTLDLSFMSISRFGATEFNFGYERIQMVIDAYYAHVNGSAEAEAQTWMQFTSDYLNDNPSICPPRPFPVNFGDSIGDLPVPDQTNCEQFVTSVRDAYIRDTYQSFLEDKKKEFIKSYIDTAMENVVENLDMKYFDKEYQYTLYYYDQAGNLFQTVPPEGVDRFDEDELESLIENSQVTVNDAINQHRSDNNIVENTDLLPAHGLVTEYRYNSLNQLVWQKTPDGGITVFAYDDLGRIIASQNAKQKINNRFSYTTYDELGRIIEAGELIPDQPISIIELQGKLVFTANNEEVSVKVEDNYPTNIASNRAEVSRTRYNDLAIDPIEIFNTIKDISQYQNTSRNRVSAIFYYDQYNGSTRERQYNHAVYYTYDIHGNVKELAQHDSVMSVDQNDPLSQIKRTEYAYDLISGNVNKVTYQKAQLDQFIHWYEYDADNRIVSVKTSGDGMIWEQDATYQYFAHGPLARTELGDKKVQGIDYAYTLHGWLKGVNSESLTPATDMGGDGTATSTVAKDAMGYSLSYYQGDYNPAGSTINNAFATTNIIGLQNSKNLYNGNIKQMVTSLIDNDESMLGTQLNHYEYDQLNRIKSMQGKVVDGLTTKDNYSADYTYDNNGNLLALNRKTATKQGNVQDMDQLSYVYKTIADPITGVQKRSNQLDHVNDAVGDAGFNDLDDQQANNYKYDAIGQLTSDEKEGIADIQWRVDGKVKLITKKDGTTIGFAYDGLGNRISKTVMPQNKTTLYARDAQGNTMAVYEADTSGDQAKELRIKEHHIYGSSRLGLEEKDIALGDTEANQNTSNEDVLYITDFTTDSQPWKKTSKATISLDNEKLAVTVDKNNHGAYANYWLYAGRTYEISMDLDVSNFTPELQVRILKNGVLFNQIFSESGRMATTITTAITGNYKIHTRLKQSSYNGGLQTYYLDNFKIVDVTNDNPSIYVTDFEDSVSTWKKTSGAESTELDSGRLEVVTAKNNHGAICNSYYLVAGKSYTISIDVDAANFEPDLEIGVFKGNTKLYSEIITDSSTFTTTITPDVSRKYAIRARLKQPRYSGFNQTFYLDNVVITEIKPQTRQNQDIGVLASNIGDKRYELSNHLGNVLSVVTDRKVVEATYTSEVSKYDFTGWETINEDNNWNRLGPSQIITIQNNLQVTVDDKNEGVIHTMLTEPGKAYKVTYDLDIQSSPNIDIEAEAFGTILTSEKDVNSGSHSISFTATEVITNISWARSRDKDEIIDTFSLDNVIISEIILDPTDHDNYTSDVTFTPDVVAYNDYYPFGMLMPNRHGQADSYRYGFNGKEKDDEVKGEGNSYDFGARMLDPRIGRWFAVDPLRNKAPGITPYRFGLNNPIKYKDPDGRWEEDGHFWTVYAFGIMSGLNKSTARMLAEMAEFYDHNVHDDLSMSMTPAPGMDFLVSGKDGGAGTWAFEAFQEGFHGLTGGPQSEVLDKAIDLVLLDNTFMQLHTVGDAWAHSYSDDASGKRIMFGADKITVPLFGRITFQHAFLDKNGNLRDGPDTTDNIADRPLAYSGYIGSLDKIYQSLNFSFSSQVKNSTNYEMFEYIQKQGGSKKDNIFLLKSYIDYNTGDRDTWITTGKQTKKLRGLLDLIGAKYTTTKQTINIKGKATVVDGTFTQKDN